MSNGLSRDSQAIERLVHRLRGRKLPAERELSQQLGISRARVRAVLGDLEARGMVARRQGSGTYALEEGSTIVASVVLLVDRRLKLGDDPFFSAVVERVQQVCQGEGIRCTLERIDPDDKPVILEDGILAVGMAARRLLERLGRQDVPAVGLFVRATPAAGARVTLLDLDDEAGGRAAVEHLVGAGCGALTFVGRRDVPASARRLAGATVLADEVRRPMRVMESGMNYAAGLSDAAQIDVPAEGPPVGVVAANDWLALGLHTGFVARGLGVRARVEIVSFDGLPITADPSLRIRSLAAPVDTMAADAVSEVRRLAAAPATCGREIVYSLR
jgi:DNA-binding LacI/PurR family transcriptional regulator